MPDNFFHQEIHPNVQSESLLTELEAMSFCPVTGCFEEEANPHLATHSFQGIVESSKVSSPG